MARRSKDHPSGFLHDHSLSLFVVATKYFFEVGRDRRGWIAVFAHSDVDGKWGQVAGNVVSD